MSEASQRLTLWEGYLKTRREISHRTHLTRPLEFAAVLRFLGPVVGESICDVGSGDGYWTSRLAVAVRVRAIGLEPSLPAVSRARRFYGSKARFVNGEARNLPFASEAFDAVVSICGLEHFQDDELALLEMNRVLVKGGKIVLTLDSLSLPQISESHRQKHKARYGVNGFYTHTSIEAKLERTGFNLARYEYLGTSCVADSLIRLQFRLGWNVNYLALVSVPLLRVAERLSRTGNAGHVLVVEAHKVE